LPLTLMMKIVSKSAVSHVGVDRHPSYTSCTRGLTLSFLFFEARFDVFRPEKKRYFFAVVKEVDFAGPDKRVLFHFAKTNDKFDDWIKFGSPRIAAFKSKVVLVKKEKKPKKLENEIRAEKELSVAAATISKAVLSQTHPQRSHIYGIETYHEPDMSVRQDSESSNVDESPQMVAAPMSGDISFLTE
jgi:hypothetical protein